MNKYINFGVFSILILLHIFDIDFDDPVVELSYEKKNEKDKEIKEIKYNKTILLEDYFKETKNINLYNEFEII